MQSMPSLSWMLVSPPLGSFSDHTGPDVFELISRGNHHSLLMCVCLSTARYELLRADRVSFLPRTSGAQGWHTCRHSIYIEWLSKRPAEEEGSQGEETSRMDEAEPLEGSLSSLRAQEAGSSPWRGNQAWGRVAAPCHPG